MAQKVTYKTAMDGQTLTTLTVDGDTMNWVLATDGSQYEWVTGKYRWGTVYYDADGKVKTSKHSE